jgi:hypothetical protein
VALTPLLQQAHQEPLKHSLEKLLNRDVAMKRRLEEYLQVQNLVQTLTQQTHKYPPTTSIGGTASASASVSAVSLNSPPPKKSKSDKSRFCSPYDVIVDYFNNTSLEMNDLNSKSTRASAVAFVKMWMYVATSTETKAVQEMADYLSNLLKVSPVPTKTDLSDVKKHEQVLLEAARQFQLRAKWDTTDAAFLEVTLLDGKPSYYSNYLWSALFLGPDELVQSGFPGNLAKLFPDKDGTEWFRSLTSAGFTQSQGGVVPRKSLDAFYKNTTTQISVLVDTHLFVSQDGATAQLSVRAIPIPASASQMASQPYSDDIPRQYSLVNK